MYDAGWNAYLGQQTTAVSDGAMASMKMFQGGLDSGAKVVVKVSTAIVGVYVEVTVLPGPTTFVTTSAEVCRGVSVSTYVIVGSGPMVMELYRVGANSPLELTNFPLPSFTAIPAVVQVSGQNRPGE